MAGTEPIVNYRLDQIEATIAKFSERLEAIVQVFTGGLDNRGKGVALELGELYILHRTLQDNLSALRGDLEELQDSDRTQGEALTECRVRLGQVEKDLAWAVGKMRELEQFRTDHYREEAQEAKEKWKGIFAGLAKIPWVKILGFLGLGSLPWWGEIVKWIEQIKGP